MEKTEPKRKVERETLALKHIYVEYIYIYILMV